MYKVDSFSDLLKDIVQKLNDSNPEVIKELPSNPECSLIIDHKDDEKAWEIQPGVWVRSGFAAHTIMQYINRLFQWCNKDKHSFELLLVVKPTDDEQN